LGDCSPSAIEDVHRGRGRGTGGGLTVRWGSEATVVPSQPRARGGRDEGKEEELETEGRSGRGDGSNWAKVEEVRPFNARPIVA
jgi:hypothetical protein